MNIIPIPAKSALRAGRFAITPATRIVADGSLIATGRHLAETLRRATGFPVREAMRAPRPQEKGLIVLTTARANKAAGPEGHELCVQPERVTIRAPGAAGAFYGAQSLLQLLPPAVFGQTPAGGVTWEVPCVHIEDAPRFKWRGLLLDVGRHFFGVAHIKSLLDQLALHKMNVLQLHLTDDQGWRVEIRKHPRLAEISAWRKETVIGKNTGRYDGARHGGFYTHADLREIIACARQRHITVVPEIEMPGHAQAALAAYPELSCTGGPFEVATSWGIMKDVFCAGNDKVFKFLEDVLTEVLALFPSEFIHIGGDECLKDRWKKCPKCQARIKARGLKDEHELQSWFVRRIERFLSGRRRRLIGWDEILEGGLAPGATVMSWRGTAGGIAAANANHDVVMTPRNPCYLDYYQSRDTAAEPFAIGGFNSLEMACEWEPIPAEVSTDKRHHILGGQANVWTEYMADWRHVEYMTHPRLAGLAEALWSPKERRGWPDFRRRLDAHLRRLDAMGVNYRRQQDQS